MPVLFVIELVEVNACAKYFFDYTCRKSSVFVLQKPGSRLKWTSIYCILFSIDGFHLVQSYKTEKCWNVDVCFISTKSGLLKNVYIKTQYCDKSIDIYTSNIRTPTWVFSCHFLNKINSVTGTVVCTTRGSASPIAGKMTCELCAFPNA